MNRSDDSSPRPVSGEPQRTGDEASYTSEAFEVSTEVGTDSPLGPPKERATSDGGTDGSSDERPPLD